MAQLLQAIDIDAEPEAVLALVRDLGRRERFLPEGWRVLRPLSARLDVPGAAIEVEGGVGPRMTTQVIQLHSVENELAAQGWARVIDGPPTAENYINTWTVRRSEAGCTVYLHSEFSYGGFVGEIFARRRLGKAHGQMLAGLKAVAEAG